MPLLSQTLISALYCFLTSLVCNLCGRLLSPIIYKQRDLIQHLQWLYRLVCVMAVSCIMRYFVASTCIYICLRYNRTVFNSQIYVFGRSRDVWASGTSLMWLSRLDRVCAVSIMNFYKYCHWTVVGWHYFVSLVVSGTIFTNISQRFKWNLWGKMLPHSFSLECMVWLHSCLSGP